MICSGLGRLRIKWSGGPQRYESTTWHLGSTYIQAYNLPLVIFFQSGQLPIFFLQLPYGWFLIINFSTVGEMYQLVLIIHETLCVMRMEIEASETVCWPDGCNVAHAHSLYMWLNIQLWILYSQDKQTNILIRSFLTQYLCYEVFNICCMLMETA